MPLTTGQVLNQRYRIVRLLGQGGFGAVYRAWDLNLKRPCALKENLDTSPESQAQFEREALILAGLSHPNLARVTDHFFIEDQGQYLVMDFVEGEDLQEMIDRSDAPLPEDVVVKWLAEVCDALEYLHNHEPPIIHRDVKPANIKITPDGKVMLVDFGIAKVYDPKLVTTVGARAITPGYSPPEQYGQGKTDKRSDIYSLGATAYTMLTGCVPPDSVDILSGNQSPPTEIRDLNPRISIPVGEAVPKAMDVNREKRYRNATEFKTALLASSAVEQVVPIEVPAVVSPIQSLEPGVERTELVRDESSFMLQDAQPVTTEEKVPQVDKQPRRWPLIVGLVLLIFILIGGGGFVIWRLIIEPAETSGDSELEISTENESEIVFPVDTNQLVIWSSQPEDSRFHEGLSAIAEYASDQLPDIQVALESLPGEELLGTYPEAVSAGGGPDLVILSSQEIESWVEMGILVPIDDFVQQDFLEGFHWKALEGMSINGDLVGLPLYGGMVGVYFNPSLIEEPPWDTEILFEVVSAGDGLSSFLSSYYLYGFFNAFGGYIFGDEGRCILQETGGVEALYYLKELQAAGASFDPDFAEAERKFIDREQAMLIAGSWRAAELRELMGDDLGMVPLPVGPRDISTPLLNLTGFYVNPNTRNIDSTIELLYLLTSPEASQIFSEITYSMPVRWDVEPPDPILGGFFNALEVGDLIGLRWEFDNYYGPFDEMFHSVLIEGAAPEEAIARACGWMNELNQK